MKIILKLKASLIMFCCLTVALFFIACKSDETPSYSDCGCKSELQKTIPESANLVGKLGFKDDSVDPYYANHYWITYVEPDCFNCVHHMIICNEGILDSRFKDVKDLPEDGFVEVKFSGTIKEICHKRTAPADITYERIILTLIERQ